MKRLSGQHLLRSLASLALVLCLAACQKPVDPFRTGLVYPLDARRLGYTKVWRVDLNLPGKARLRSAELLDDLVLTVEVPSNLVTALRAQDGKVLWTRQVGNRGEEIFTPTRRGDRILVNTETHLFVLDALSGRPLQSNPLSFVVITAPVVHGQLAIFAAAEGRVFAQRIGSGQVAWSYQMPAGVRMRPAVLGDNVLVADITGYYKMLDANDGRPLWSGRSFAPNSQPVLTEFGPFIASQDTFLYALDSATGKDRWQYAATTPLHQAPALIGSVLYQSLGPRGLVALDPATGKLLWQSKDPATPITEVGDALVLYVRPRLELVDAATGRPRSACLSREIDKTLALPDGSLILISNSGAIECLQPHAAPTAPATPAAPAEPAAE
ncbi:MAG: PQQ-binding-like beta-propeller repeat protein [Phycisphaeraceae bacterium]|nr:PQQ-binding-like beta-propeller repeat protein [Phycisphaeraceae bacterium]